MIGPENVLYFLNQSDVKLKPIMTWSLAFLCASFEQFIFTLSSYRLHEISSFHFIGDYFGFFFHNTQSKTALWAEPLALSPGLYLVMVIIREVISIG